MVVVKAILFLALPVVVFVVGVYVMSKFTRRQSVLQRLQRELGPEHSKPLHQRLTGYDVADARRYWGALDAGTRAQERRFLQVDLIFPLFYGAALAGGLLSTWAALDRPFHGAWLLLPVAITLAADWTENVVQLRQLRLYAVRGADGVTSGGIRVASIATVVKLIFFSGTYLLLGCLTVWMVARALSSPS